MFLDLPAETVLQILKHCDKSDLHLLSLTSKAARELAEPLLYANIECVAGDSGSPLLLRTILQRPELALAIKQLSINTPWNGKNGCSWRVTDHLPDLQPRNPSPDIAKRALSLVHEVDFPEIPRWQKALNQGSIDAVVALFLSQLKRLEVLVIEPECAHRSFFLGTALQHLIQNRASYFGCLRDIKCRETLESYMVRDLEREVCEVFSFFHLPSLETLELTLHRYDFESWYSKEPSLKASRSLTTLRLFYCDLGLDQIAKLLRSAPALKIFRCGLLCHDEDLYGGDVKLSFRDLQSSLSALSNTLEDLTIRTTVCSKNGHSHVSPGQMGTVPMGSLQHLHVLSRLELSAILLLGVYPSPDKRLSDLLPSSLRSLTLILIDECYPPIKYKKEDSPEPTMQTIIDILEVYLADSTSCAPFLEDITLMSVQGSPNNLRKISSEKALSKKIQQLRPMAHTLNVAIHIHLN